MTKNTPSGAKKQRESTEPESRQTAKMFHLLLLLLVQQLRDSFTMVFVQNSSIFHWAVHQPIAFFQVWSHTRRFEPLTEEPDSGPASVETSGILFAQRGSGNVKRSANSVKIWNFELYGGLEGHSASGSGSGPGRVRSGSGSGPERVRVGSGAGPDRVRGGSVRLFLCT